MLVAFKFPFIKNKLKIVNLIDEFPLFFISTVYYLHIILTAA